MGSGFYTTNFEAILASVGVCSGNVDDLVLLSGFNSDDHISQFVCKALLFFKLLFFDFQFTLEMLNLMSWTLKQCPTHYSTFLILSYVL
jgi:hypothetical protein